MSKLTIWSVDGVSVLDFNVYLVGYDVQTINLRDVIASGILPRTASAGQDPADTISPKGSVLSQDVNFSSCTGILPPSNLAAPAITDLRAALTGDPIPGQGNLCAGPNLGDDVARGYVTVDQVTACNALAPDDAGFFSSIDRRNNLYGDFTLVNPSQNFAQSDLLVAIEASPSNPLVTTSGNYTFYGAFANTTAVDNREPLGTRWATMRITENTGSASALVWRDRKRVVTPFNCGGGSTALNISAGTVTDRDSLGNAQATATAGSVAPRASQRLPVAPGSLNSSLIGVSSRTGWLEFDLNHMLGSGNVFGNNAQSYPIPVTGSFSGGEGRFSVAGPPVQLATPSVPAAGAPQ